MEENNKDVITPENSSLENVETVSNTSETSNSNLTSDATPPPVDNQNTPVVTTKQSLFQRFQHYINHVNIYLLLFLLLLLLTGMAGFASYQASKKAGQPSITNQTLSPDDLSSLVSNETQVGDATQILTVASNSIFNGQVLMRENLDVAGTIRIGKTVTLPELTVSGNSSLQDLQIGNNLSVTGNAFVQGILTARGGLAVNGSATFAGTISAPSLAIDQLILNQNLQLNRHIEAGGNTPGVYSGTGIGAGGTVSINGSDTAGTVTLNFGSGPVAGVLANITFTNSFNQTPHVVITPVGSNCAALNYYVNRSASNFSIATANAGPANNSCSFDYIAID